MHLENEAKNLPLTTYLPQENVAEMYVCLKIS